MDRLPSDVVTKVRIFIDFKSTWVASSVSKRWKAIFEAPNPNEISTSDVAFLPLDKKICQKVLSTVRKYCLSKFTKTTPGAIQRLLQLEAELGNYGYQKWNANCFRSLTNVQHVVIQSTKTYRLALFSACASQLISLTLPYNLSDNYFTPSSTIFTLLLGSLPLLQKLTLTYNHVELEAVELLLDSLDALP